MVALKKVLISATTCEATYTLPKTDVAKKTRVGFRALLGRQTAARHFFSDRADYAQPTRPPSRISTRESYDLACRIASGHSVFLNGAVSASITHLYNHEGGIQNKQPNPERELKPHLIIYDELEVVYNQQARILSRALAPIRFVGFGLYKLAERFNNGDPISQGFVKDLLDQRNYPDSLGKAGTYQIRDGAFLAGSVEVGDQYLGSVVVATFPAENFSQRFVDLLDKVYNIAPGSVSQIDVRRHFTEILYEEPNK